MYSRSDVSEGDGRCEEKWFQVKLWIVIRPDTPLPISESHDCREFLCTTLGEAYNQKIPVWWRQRDIAVRKDNDYVRTALLM
jgi:hypothetical protein